MRGVGTESTGSALQDIQRTYRCMQNKCNTSQSGDHDRVKHVRDEVLVHDDRGTRAQTDDGRLRAKKDRGGCKLRNMRISVEILVFVSLQPHSSFFRSQTSIVGLCRSFTIIVCENLATHVFDMILIIIGLTTVSVHFVWLGEWGRRISRLCSRGS